jgi:hypothetical protein
MHDRGTEPFVKTVDRGMHKTAHAIGRGRVNQLLLATDIQGGDEDLLLPLLCYDPLTEPLDQRLRP